MNRYIHFLLLFQRSLSSPSALRPTRRVLTALLLIGMLFSCKKLVEVPPPVDQLVASYVFEEDATALAAMIRIYAQMTSSLSFASGGSFSTTQVEGLYADELISFSSVSSGQPQNSFYFNNIISSNSVVSSTWNGCYSMIYGANSVLEGLNASTTVSKPLKDQLMGEAFFIRAFCHFYLVNLFGDVPLVLTADYRKNAVIPRTPGDQVYAGIIADLLQAKSLLSADYPSAGRARPNKGVATALLSRAYLYAGDYVKAEAQASELIGNTAKYRLLADLDKVFLKESEETIWYLQSPPTYFYTNEGAAFILTAPPSSIALRPALAEAFPAGDRRREHWVGSLSSASGLTTWYYAYKYKQGYTSKVATEYSVVLRLAEQYLIRAEARAQQNKLAGEGSAAEDLNAIRSRAGLTGSTASTKEQLLAEIAQQRRLELFTEWGHRFFDLKRYGQLDAVLTPIKSNWESYRALWPLPLSEILANPNLKQNPHY